MRVIPILPNENFIYCFKVQLANNKRLSLTSWSEAISADGIIFIPYSGLTLQEAVFNDCAQNHVILEGIFEEGGIEESFDLAGAKVEIMLYYPQSQLQPFLTYYCSLYTKRDLSFTLCLEPESAKYNQSLLNIFSRSCRANFGDDKCKLNKSDYSMAVIITHINGRMITTAGIDKESGYFSGGEALIGARQFSAKIYNHVNNNIELAAISAFDLREGEKIILMAGCDKRLITCCNKFNNAVNFRGEPFIPEHDFLKVS